MSIIARGIDATLEATVGLSFTSVGPSLRRRLWHWTEPHPGALRGKNVVITGATSGIGREAALRMAQLGARVLIVARNPSKTSRVIEELQARVPLAQISAVQANMGILADVRRASREIADALGTVHVLVHNAGALEDTFEKTSDGIERTIASHVVGPYLMTELLRPALAQAQGSKVIWVSSGGMYAEPLRVDALEMDAGNYDGVVAYARAKRAQVTLTHVLAEALRAQGTEVHAMHPGWVDTPGVERSLPRFYAALKPLLRDVAGGADTIVFLASDASTKEHSGSFWLDRAPRRTHWMQKTAKAETAREQERLVDWVRGRAGLPSH
jgi:NAD(P)-dependent dehydrogenase (short-subunit alcohol dehydrogenase family)